MIHKRAKGGQGKRGSNLCLTHSYIKRVKQRLFQIVLRFAILVAFARNYPSLTTITPGVTVMTCTISCQEICQVGKKEGIPVQALAKSIMGVVKGQFETNLGGYIYKKRVARPGHGKSGVFGP